jgi:enoyl-CoA hydratase
MELVLCGRPLLAPEAAQAGLVCRVVPVETFLDEAKKLALEISQKPPLAVKLAKQAVLKAFESPLRDGLEFERQCFYLLFSSQDQKEGMSAFLEKRKPGFKGK